MRRRRRRRRRRREIKNRTSGKRVCVCLCVYVCGVRLQCRGFTDLELLLQARLAPRTRCEDAVDVAMELSAQHLSLLAHDGLHQGIMNENVLLLNAEGKSQAERERECERIKR